MSSHKLNNKWDFWFHNPCDNNWSISSYNKIHEISNIKDFWILYNKISPRIIQNSMFFLMRTNIDPMWEHTENITGGSWSFKILKENVSKIWFNISIALLGENITNNQDNIINGISISPKKHFCIIKIWNKQTQFNNIKLLKKIKDLSYDGVIYKSHVK